MNKHAKLFLLVALAAGLAHFLIVQGLTLVVASKSGGASLILVPVLWVLTAPTNFLLSSSFGRTLSPVPFNVLFAGNSLMWGLAISGVASWRRKYE